MRSASMLLALAGPAIAVLLLLWLTGALASRPALAAGAALLAVAIGLTAIWRRDIGLVDARLDAPDRPHPWPLTPAAERLSAGIERLARGLADRAAEAEAARRANDAIVDRLPDPLILLDAAGVPRRMNGAARAAFGDELGAILRHPGLRAALDRARASGAPETADLALPVPVPRDLEARAIPLDPPLPDGSALLLVLADRSRERAVERTRADFVANASHELRTPLASLVGFIDTLRGPAADDPPAQARFLAIMAEQAGRMHRLIDDLLSLSRVELVEHLPPEGRVDVAALVAEVARGFEPRLADGATLSLDLADGLDVVPGDADQLAQVLTNLIDNALKYGGGTVRIGLAAADRPGVVLRVADDGPGIPRADLPRLTERFYRADKARSRATGGTGLGLAIVKHIVNRHRGQLTIESAEGRGTTVNVWLPSS